MKKLMMFMALCALAACSGTSVSYERAIEDYARSTIRGIKPDYSVRVLDPVRTGEITVADSLGMLAAEFEKDKASRLEQAATYLATLQSLSDAQQSNRFVPESEKRELVVKVAAQQAVIDSLGASTPPAAYAGREGSEVLAHIVRSRVEIVEPSTDRTLSETYDFFMSPDGSVCYGKSKAK